MIHDFGGWQVGIVAALMVTAIKASSFAWCYADGGKDDDELSQDQRERKIIQFPTLLEFFSYMFYYAGTLVGPTYDFIEYKEFIEKAKGYKDIPSSFMATMKEFLLALFFMVNVVFIMPLVPVNYCATNEYDAHGLFYKFWYYNLAITLARFKYYSAWTLGQAAITASGLSFNGYENQGDKKVAKWDRIVAARPELELIGDPRKKLELWNNYTQVWLKRYVYFRVCPENMMKANPRRVNIATFCTLVMSAFWHGFYPMYYFVFIQLSVVVLVSKCIFKASYKFDRFPPIVNTILRQLITNVVFNYLGNGFILLDTTKGLKFYQSIYYIPMIMILGSYIFFVLTGWGQRSPKKGNETAKTKGE